MELVFDKRHQPVLVARDIEDDPIANETRASKLRFDIGRPSPRCRARQDKPSLKRLTAVFMISRLPKGLESRASDDSHAFI
jgi:hypothetical protein